MKRLRVLSAAEQVAEHVRRELAAGTWRDEMPGAMVLAASLGVNHKTAEAALRLLEKEGLLENQGTRKPRRVRSAVGALCSPSLRIGILLHNQRDCLTDYVVKILHRLLENGHAPFFAKRSLSDLGMDAGRVAAWVGQTPADAWVVISGSRAVLEWFAAQPFPVCGLFGVVRRLPIAGTGPDKTPAYVDAARALTAHGHRRIVLLARPQRRNPQPGRSERHFLQALGEAGIEVGDYHFPDWEDTREGFQRCLEGLFRNTPPTALMVQEPELFGAVEQFLLTRGIRVPQDVSLICDDPDPTFVWRVPTVAHIRWESEPWVRRITRWADRIARGEKDRRSVFSRAVFIPGETIATVGQAFGTGPKRPPIPKR